MDEHDSEVEIRHITAAEGVRLRPEMYLRRKPDGALVTNVRNTLLLDALCLSLAEAHCGTCTAIHVQASGCTAVISDNGLGLSLEKDKWGNPMAERVFSLL